LIQHDPTLIQHDPTLIQHDPTLIQHDPTLIQHDPTLIQHDPTLIQHDPKLTEALGRRRSLAVRLTPVQRPASLDPGERQEVPGGKKDRTRGSKPATADLQRLTWRPDRGVGVEPEQPRPHRPRSPEVTPQPGPHR